MGDINYVIGIKTGDVADAGTDADISVQVYGRDFGATRAIKLDKPNYNDFERGDYDAYAFTDRDVGELSHVVFFINASAYLSDGWYLESLFIIKVGTNERWTATINEWIKSSSQYINEFRFGPVYLEKV